MALAQNVSLSKTPSAVKKIGTDLLQSIKQVFSPNSRSRFAAPDSDEFSNSETASVNTKFDSCCGSTIVVDESKSVGGTPTNEIDPFARSKRPNRTSDDTFDGGIITVKRKVKGGG